jgi:hypothetical protein
MRVEMVSIALFLMAGCKDKHATATAPATPSSVASASGQAGAKAGVSAPAVAVATVLAKDGKRPPFLLLIDDAGAARVAAAASWADLDNRVLAISKKAGPVDLLYRFIREEVGLGRDSVASIARWDEYADYASLADEVKRPSTADQDDPPPPPPEDMPDDGTDDSGGTGTMIQADEGKLGRKDSARAEGQYKMAKTTDDPALARQQAIEQARAAGILGGPIHGPKGAASTLFPPEPNPDGTPARMATVTGTVVEDGHLERLRAMVLVPPTMKAHKLIELVTETGAAIAVSYAGKLRPLRLDFEPRFNGQSSKDWLEARVSAKGIVVEAVPDVPVEVTDIKELAAALTKAREARGADPAAPVDVLVDPEVDTQRLVDVLVALDTAGVRAIGMGKALPPEELARRGHRIPTATLGQPAAQGDLDKAVIRQVVKASKAKLEACYSKALASEPTLTGTVQAQFFISPAGTVANAAASGVSPAVSTCVAGVIKTLVFPKPKGGGGVQVNYPFTMRP